MSFVRYASCVKVPFIVRVYYKELRVQVYRELPESNAWCLLRLPVCLLEWAVGLTVCQVGLTRYTLVEVIVINIPP